MTDLTNYRLAIGQPDQAGFLQKVRDNPYLAAADPRGLTLNLFPSEYREATKTISLENGPLKRLVRDARAYLDSENRHPRKRQLRSAAERCIRHVDEYLSATSERKVSLSLKAARVVEALRYLVDPHDKNNDRTPEIGFNDDLEGLREASEFWCKTP